MDGFPALEAFTNSLSSNEQVLRGGFLKEPHLFTNLVAVQGRPYIKVCSNNLKLRMFFSGQSEKRSWVQRRLAVCLAALRDQKQDELFMDTPQALEEDVAMDSLGDEVSSDSPPCAPSTKQPSPEIKKARRKQNPAVKVALRFGDESVDMRILTVVTKSEQPSVEASIENFRAMFCWCQIEATKQEDVASPPRPTAARAPRSPPNKDGRDYFRKDRNCYYTMHSRKHGGNKAGWQPKNTEVCTRRKVGRPLGVTRTKSKQKEPTLLSDTSESSAAFEFSSSSDSFASGLAECPMAVSPSDENSPEF